MTAPRASKAAVGRGDASTRVRLARLAREVALGFDAVAEGSAGPRRQWITSDRGDVLAGVLVVARRDGRFEVQLHLILSWPVPPLHELAERIRARVERAAEMSGLGGALGPVGVFFADVAEPASAPPTVS